MRPAVWTSPDGCAWRRATVVAVTPDGERTGFSAVARRGRLVVAQGRSYSQVHGNIRPTLWRSTGGAPLREVELLREVFGGEGGISVDALVATPEAFLATGAYVGPDKSVAAQVWRCTDGADWVRLPPGRAQSSTAVEQLLPRDLAAGAAGTVIVGTALQVVGGKGFDGAAWSAPAAPGSGGGPTWLAPGWPATATSGCSPTSRSATGSSRSARWGPATASGCAPRCPRTGRSGRPAASCPARRCRPPPGRPRTSRRLPGGGAVAGAAAGGVRAVGEPGRPDVDAGGGARPGRPGQRRGARGRPGPAGAGGADAGRTAAASWAAPPLSPVTAERRKWELVHSFTPTLEQGLRPCSTSE